MAAAKKRPRSYGAAIGYARELLATTGIVVPWQVNAEGFEAGHVMHRLVHLGEAVQIMGSTLYATPAVAAKIQTIIDESKAPPDAVAAEE